MRKILFNRDDEIIAPLRLLIEKQNHRTLVRWTIDCAESILAIFEKRHAKDLRPRYALEAAIAWREGKIKMGEAKAAALASHAAANELAVDDLAAEAAARAMGHVVGTVHVKTHAIGLVLYGLTAIYHEFKDERQRVIDQEIRWMLERLLYWEKQIEQDNGPWAHFLLKEE